MSTLSELFDAHDAAVAVFDGCGDENDDDLWEAVDWARDAILQHRPASLDETRAKAAFMKSRRTFTEWEDFDRVTLIDALTPRGVNEAVADKPIEQPLVALIEGLRWAESVINSGPTGRCLGGHVDLYDDDEYAAIVSALHGPIRTRLVDWQSSALTHDEALAALALAREKTGDLEGDPDLALAMINAACGYFELQNGSGGSKAAVPS